jgi:hypothetical protein
VHFFKHARGVVNLRRTFARPSSIFTGPNIFPAR